MINIYISDNNRMIYFIMVLLSICGGLLIAYLIMRRQNINRNISIASLGINFSLIFLGAIVYTMISSYLSDGQVKIGLSSLGAMLGILLGSFLTVKIADEDSYKIFKSFVFALPFMYSIGKIGCTFMGCCKGFKYYGFMSVYYHGEISNINDCPVFPVQLLEVIVFAIIFIVCLKNIQQYSASLVVAICAISKFILDFFREEHFSGKIITNNQFVCIIIVFVIIIKKYFFMKNIKR